MRPVRWMLLATGREIIPESHRKDHGACVTAGLIGVVLMMLLDTALG